MTDQHPITTPLELVEQWREQAPPDRRSSLGRELWLIDRSADWGYDQRGEVNEAKLQQARDEELEACCQLLDGLGEDGERLRLHRRCKPPSLKKQMLARTKAILNDPNRILLAEVRETLELNQRALKALPDD